MPFGNWLFISRQVRAHLLGFGVRNPSRCDRGGFDQKLVLHPLARSWSLLVTVATMVLGFSSA